MKNAASALLRRTPIWRPSRAVYRTATTPLHKLRFAANREHIARSVFIVGCGHSGTSLLLRILGEHPDVFAPSVETLAFFGGVRWPTLDRLYADARKSGRPVLVEKTPSHIHSVDMIRETVPGALFIIATRDGRDIVASIAHRHGGSYDYALARWQRDSAASAEQIGRTDTHLWRYEDFIENPNASIEAACGFLGIGYDPAMLEYHRRTKPYLGHAGDRKGSGAHGPEHAALRAWQVNQPITDSRGRWKTSLPPQVASIFAQEPHRSLMLRLGYTTE